MSPATIFRIHLGLRAVAALRERVSLALAQVDGPARSAARHCYSAQLPLLAGELRAGYAIPIVYVPLLMITHVIAFYLLMRPQPQAAQAVAG
jgi:hypothetical protein